MPLRLFSLLLLALAAGPLAATAAEPGPALADVATTTTTPHRLVDVRVRPLPEALRVMLVFDRAAPYLIRRDEQQPRLWIDLIHTQVDYLPPELGRIADDRLAGIWLRRQDATRATLELRLFSGETTVEDFTLSDPPMLVIDLARTDRPHLRVAAASTPALSDGLIGARGAVVPGHWLDDPTSGSTPVVAAPETASDPSSPTQHIELAAGVAAHTTDTLTTASVVLSRAGTAPADEALRRETGPTAADYDYFPIHAIEVGSQLAQETLDAFMERRWASAIKGQEGVLDRALAHLRSNPVSRETISMIYLMAEARWQLGQQQGPAAIGDMINFYEQAVRVYSAGELASFAHWRLGQLHYEQKNHQLALEHLRLAMQAEPAELRRRAWLLAGESLLGAGRHKEALDLTERLEQGLRDQPTMLTLALIRGRALTELGRHEEASLAFAEADSHDAHWIQRLPVALEARVEAALHSGRLDEARTLIELLHQMISGDEERRVRLLLLYAEVLERAGEEDAAADAYNQILTRLGETPDGAELQKKLFARWPDDVLRGEGLYCMLLFRRGQIKQAMTELDRAWRQCLAEGIETRPLLPAIRAILPPFIEHALDQGQYHDVMQAWRQYGFAIEEQDARRRCFVPLVDALEELGLEREALGVLARLEREGLLIGPRTLLQTARLKFRLGQYEAALEGLEALHEEELDGNQRMALYELLARTYGELARPLEAAQSWQLLASTPGLDGVLLVDALLEAGELFLEAGMPLQAVELALKGLIHEKRAQSGEAAAPWPAVTSAHLRFLLARAYDRQRDHARTVIAAEDALAGQALPAETAIQTRLLLAGARRQLGQSREALALYEEVAGDPAAPAPWRDYARLISRTIRWDMNHSQWTVDWTPGE